MENKRKLFVSIFAILALAALALLSIGLTGLELLPGEPFPFDLTLRYGMGYGGTLPGGQAILMVVRIVYLIAVILFPFAIIMFVLSPTLRREFFKWLKKVMPFVLTLLMIGWVIQNLRSKKADPERFGLPGAGELPAALPGAEKIIPEPPQWLILIISLVVVIIFIAIVVGIVLYIWRRQQYREPPVERIALEARQALEDIQSGADLRNAVLRCYYQMSRAVSEQRKLSREQAMTPREFEMRLSQHGLPAEPVRQLTRLFEEVRYGVKVPGELEERQATASLIAILEACRSLT